LKKSKDNLLELSLIKQTKHIYSKLEDDLSKRIFENNLLFSMTENIEFIRNMVSYSYGNVFNKCSEEVNKKLGNSPEVIVYGAGYMGACLLSFFDKVTAFCDSDEKKQGSTYYGYNIITPGELTKRYSNSTVAIAIIDEKAIATIKSNLIKNGFSEDKIIDFRIIFNIVHSHLPHLGEEQYFDTKIIKPILSKEEIFIDAGCCNCYTVNQFIQKCNNEYRKIIAFEPSPKQYKECTENSKNIRDIKIHQCGLWNENTDIYFNDESASTGGAHISGKPKDNATKIKARKLDDILNGEEATFIKMDVEGAELNALKGAAQTILKYRPKLAICVYHKPEDIIEIPAYILSLHNDYKIYLRHYSLWHGETVLYAI